MSIRRKDIILKIHLIISVLIVIPVALLYGFNPSYKFDIHLTTIDEINAFKAIMGLYLGFSGLWLLGIVNNNYLRIALISNIVFMLGLSFGRLISIFIDGMPSIVYVFGTFGELLIGIYGIWALKSFGLTKKHTPRTFFY